MKNSFRKRRLQRLPLLGKMGHVIDADTAKKIVAASS
jgi:hypothetical protein